MKSLEYRDLSERTLSGEFHLKEELDFNLLHGAIGLCTEAGELIEAVVDNNGIIDVVNVKEELGDMLWYLAIFERFFDVIYDIDGMDTLVADGAYDDKPLVDTVNLLAMYSSRVLDTLKKKAFYGKKIDLGDLDIQLTLLHMLIERVAVGHLNCTLDEIRKTNIDKLVARFGDKFSSEQAINRDLDSERAILEGK